MSYDLSGYFVKVKVAHFYHPGEVGWSDWSLLLGEGNLEIDDVHEAISEWVKERGDMDFIVMSMQATDLIIMADSADEYPIAEFYELEYRNLDTNEIGKLLVRAGCDNYSGMTLVHPLQYYAEECCGHPCEIINSRLLDTQVYIDYGDYVDQPYPQILKRMLSDEQRTKVDEIIERWIALAPSYIATDKDLADLYEVWRKKYESFRTSFPQTEQFTLSMYILDNKTFDKALEEKIVDSDLLYHIRMHVSWIVRGCIRRAIMGLSDVDKDLIVKTLILGGRKFDDRVMHMVTQRLIDSI